MDVLDRMGSHHHPQEEYLERYVMKSCSERETEAIENHLLICEECRKRLYLTEEYVALMKAALPLGPRRLPAFRWSFSFGTIFTRPFAMAGCAAVLLALLCVPAILRDMGGKDELVRLSATRGDGARGVATARSLNHLLLQIDTTGLSGPLEAQVVDHVGIALWSHSISDAGEPLRLDQKLTPGTYWVRVISAAGERRILRETGLRVE